MTQHADAVLAVDLAVLPDWLAESQPQDPADCSEWWLSLIVPLSFAVFESPGVAPEMVRRLLVVIERGVAAGALTPGEGAVRLAYLSARLAGRTGGRPVPVEVQPDAAVRRCLGEIELDPQEASALADRWRAEPETEVRALRAAKMLLAPVRILVDHIGDPNLAAEARRWLELSRSLP